MKLLLLILYEDRIRLTLQHDRNDEHTGAHLVYGIAELKLIVLEVGIHDSLGYLDLGCEDKIRKEKVKAHTYFCPHIKGLHFDEFIGTA